MGTSEKPAASCEETGRTDAASRHTARPQESSQVDQESRETRRENRKTLSPDQERERLARWLRLGETWLPEGGGV